MSRTAHHVSRRHWNIKEPDYVWRYDYEPWKVPGKKRVHFRCVGRIHEVVEYYEVGYVMYGLRFYAGCKRIPAKLKFEVNSINWLGHNGTKMVQVYAKKRHQRARTEERIHQREVLKLVRANETCEDVLDPEGRTRHQALWDAN